jgi:RNA polymerase sigma-70 factor (ECF subfamily)
MGASPAAADDVAQDAFLAAFESVTDYRGEGTFAGWVKRIAARLYLRRLQKEKRLADLAQEVEDEFIPPADPDAAGRIDLDEAMKGLGEAERLCVSMCYGAGPWSTK